MHLLKRPTDLVITKKKLNFKKKLNLKKTRQNGNKRKLIEINGNNQNKRSIKRE